MSERNVYDIFLNTKEQADFKHYFLSDEEIAIKVLPKFNTINIFVGANNSGKSWFMRTLMKQQQLWGINEYNNLKAQTDNYNKIIKGLDIDWKANLNNITDHHTFSSVTDSNSHIYVREIEFEGKGSFFEDPLLTHSQNLKALKIVKKILRHDYVLNIFFHKKSEKIIKSTPELIEGVNEAIEINETILREYYTKNLRTSFHYFIPTQRTAHSLFEQKDKIGQYTKYRNNLFADTIIKNYGLQDLVVTDITDLTEEEMSKKILVFSGLNLYNHIINMRNGVKADRSRFDAFEKFIGRSFFNTEFIDIVAKLNYDKIHKGEDNDEFINVLIGKEQKEGKNLYELGDGIQALIILMYGIFMAPENTIIFIDEPEMNLHPGMQRLFLEQITANEALTQKNLRYVISTHSNHLLDLMLNEDEVSIYSFSKDTEKSKFIIKNVNAGDNALLRDLGVNNSSVFLANCSLWVEGISDRNYLKAFVIAYYNCIMEENIGKNKSFPKEDIDYAFFEYAGSNLDHYEFGEDRNESIRAFALNNRIFIVGDNDKGKEEKHEKYKQLCKLNPQNLLYESTEPYREIENLLSEDIWEKVLISLCNKTKVKNSTDDLVQTEISQKISNNKIDDFKEKYIGEYLKSLQISYLNDVWEETAGIPKSLKSNYKVLLSKLVLDKTISGDLKWEHFEKNDWVRKNAKKMYDFIMNR